MKDFVYDSGVKIIYGENQMKLVTEEISKIGKKVLIVPTDSFVTGGHYEELKRNLNTAGIQSVCLNAGREPLLSKVNEGIGICANKQIQAVIGIGGGVCMDLAKAIAFGAVNDDVPMEKFLTYECTTEGRPQLPVVTIPTNPMSGSETNADIQITLDDSGLQVGCPVGKAVFTWLNPAYMVSLPDHILTYGQMTAFVQLSINYLNLCI